MRQEAGSQDPGKKRAQAKGVSSGNRGVSLPKARPQPSPSPSLTVRVKNASCTEPPHLDLISRSGKVAQDKTLLQTMHSNICCSRPFFMKMLVEALLNNVITCVLYLLTSHLLQHPGGLVHQNGPHCSNVV